MKLSRKIGILSGVVIAALVAWFAISAKQTPDSVPENVIFITVDTLRSDHLGCYGYERIKTPNIDGLAERGTMFKNAISQVPLTLPSHCSLFTSTYPQFNNVRDNGSYRLGQSAVTLAERMQENGYATAAFVSAFVLDSKFGLDQGFETYDDRMQQNIGKKIIEHMEAERTADKVTDAAVSWLRNKKASKTFLWVHYFDPHAVYNPPAPYRELYKDNPYDGEIAFTDEHIGVLLAALKELKLDENSLIIFAADHAEGLGEHEEFGHSVFIYDTTLKVPLIFSCPGLVTEGKVIEGQVRLVDVMPTILDFLQIERNKEIQGKSLIGLMKGRIKSLNLPAYSESLYAKLRYNWSELKSFRTAEWKYIKSPEPELYNTKNDPQELVNLADSRMDVVKEMDNRLETFLTATSSSGEAPATAEIDEETRRKLMSLGYIGGDAAPGSEEPVPRKLIRVMEKMNLSARLANEGLIDKAIEGFREVVKIDQKNTEAYINLAQCYEGLGKYDEAITHFEIAASFKPDDPVTINDIGTCYTKKMDFGKALDQFNKAIELDAELPQIYYNRGLAYRKLGNLEHAIEDYDKAIELDAEFAEAYSNRGGVYERTGNYQRALEDYDKAIELAPQSAEAYYNRGVVYQKSGNQQQAIKDYDNVIELKPRFKPAYYNRGLAYDQSGNQQQAIGNYIKVIGLDPKFALAYVRLAKGYEKQEQYEAAIEAWKKVSEIRPQQHEARKNLTRLRGLTHQ
jgi:arylsulfatase A-like enzyme/Tfp pilus assembly protein PilF